MRNSCQPSAFGSQQEGRRRGARADYRLRPSSSLSLGGRRCSTALRSGHAVACAQLLLPPSAQATSVACAQLLYTGAMGREGQKKLPPSAFLLAHRSAASVAMTRGVQIVVASIFLLAALAVSALWVGPALAPLAALWTNVKFQFPATQENSGRECPQTRRQITPRHGLERGDVALQRVSGTLLPPPVFFLAIAWRPSLLLPPPLRC